MEIINLFSLFRKLLKIFFFRGFSDNKIEAKSHPTLSTQNILEKITLNRMRKPKPWTIEMTKTIISRNVALDE